MATLDQIKSPVWTVSISGGGAIAEGIEAIRQCIDIIIRTTKGSDPLRPEFGSDVYKYQDKPVSIAIPNVKKAILEAIEIWEQRVTVTNITHSSNKSQLFFNINYRLKDTELSDSLTLFLNNGGIVTNVTANTLILRGLFPPNPNAYQYQLKCVLDGSDLLPAPPEMGFADVNEMYIWAKANWFNFGNWYLTADALVLYVNPGYSTGSIEVSLIIKNKFQGGIPAVPAEYKYAVAITVGVMEYDNDIDLFTVDDILYWLQNDTILGALGQWQIATIPGEFNEDFNEDFNLYSQLLVLYTSESAVIITVSIIPE